jgi:4-hydroxy-tetrahydrodipicolinate reductase
LLIIDYDKAEKIDAPRGTSRKLAYKLSQIRQPVLHVPIENTSGDQRARGARIKGSQVHSLRLPGFLSSAEVVFGLPGERLSIRHDSVDSAQPYVSGTLLAIRKVPSIKGLVRGLEQLMNLKM